MSPHLKTASLCIAAVLAGLAAAIPLEAAAQTAPPTFTVNRFLSLLGVDTHLANTDSTYGEIQSSSGSYVSAGPYVMAAANYLTIHGFRDGTSNDQNNNGSSPITYYEAFAAKHVRFTFVDQGNSQADLAATLALIDDVNESTPGSVIAVEGANEVDNDPPCWNDGSGSCTGGLQGAEAEQTALFGMVRADPNLPNAKVDYFTGWGGVSGGPGSDPTQGKARNADDDNQHPYPAFGQPPYYWMSRPIALNNTSNPATHAVYTEMGYAVGPLYGPDCNGGAGGVCWNDAYHNPNGTRPQVDATTQAKLTLDIPLDALLDGIQHVYVYELLEAYPSGDTRDGGFGMFDYSVTGQLQPRPVATALRNLMRLPAAFGRLSGSAANTPVPLNYTVSGLPSSGYCPTATCNFNPTLAIQQPNGHYMIVVWAEQEIWDADTHSEVTAANTYTAQITLPQTFSRVDVYDPYTSATAVATTTGVKTVSVTVTDRPMLVELTP